MFKLMGKKELKFYANKIYLSLPMFFCPEMKEGSCADPESFDRGGPLLTMFYFLVVEGREDPNTTISGPSLVRQRNAIKMVFRWRANDGPTLKSGLVAA